MVSVALHFVFTLASPDGSLAQTTSKTTYPTFGTIERNDPRLGPDRPARSGNRETRRWLRLVGRPGLVKGGGYLLFSDVPQNTVYQWKDGEKVRVFLKPSGYTGATARGGEPGSNGLNVDSQGRLILCQHGDRRVARLAEDGKSFETLADRYHGTRLNSPNDSVYKSNGDLYFTDPPYGLLKLNDDPAKELPYNGVYRLSRDGTVTLLTKEMTYPNGIAFSPDEKTLYVANSDPRKGDLDGHSRSTIRGPSKKGGSSTTRPHWPRPGRKGFPTG